MVYEENIKQALMGNPIWINELYHRFPNKKAILIKDYKKMVRKRIVNQQKVGNRIYLSLAAPKFDVSLSMVMSSLPLAEKRANACMKKLRESKPIFLPYKIVDGEKTSFKMKPRNKKYLDQILVIINDLASRSVALTYAQCLSAVPKGSTKLVRLYHKNCIRIIKKIMDKLEKEFGDTDHQLGAYLYYGIHGYSHLTTLEFMNKGS